MPARIVRSREAVRPNETFLQFSVYRSGDDGQVCGYQIFNRQNGDREPSFVSTPFGVPVEAAWRPACQFAQEHDIQVVWVNDPENLFAIPEAASPPPDASTIQREASRRR